MSSGARAVSPADSSIVSAQDVAQAGRDYLTRAVYTTCYCASYGVTFPVVFLAHLIPGGHPLAAGLADGARAARVYVRGTQLAQKRMRRHEPKMAEATH